MCLGALVRRLWHVDERISSLAELDLDDLYNNKGITALVLDVDITIMDYHGTTKTKDTEKVARVKSQIAVAKQKSKYAREELGMRIALFSNCSKEREDYLREEFGDSADIIVGQAYKPFTFRLWKLIHNWMSEPGEIAVIGDQYLTDIMLGNWVGAYIIKVDDKELTKTEPRFKQIQRRFEEWIYKRAFAKYLKK